jgi:hypothetical protein
MRVFAAPTVIELGMKVRDVPLSVTEEPVTEN